jgi:hypothetical protein
LGRSESSPTLFTSPPSTFSEKEVNDFASAAVFFAGDAFVDDDSPLDEVLFVLIDFVGDFDDFTDGALGCGLVFVGDFFDGGCFTGDSF